MREFRGPFRFFVWYTVILRSAGPAVLTILLVYGVMHSLFLPYFRSNIRESRKMVAFRCMLAKKMSTCVSPLAQ